MQLDYLDKDLPSITLQFFMLKKSKAENLLTFIEKNII